MTRDIYKMTEQELQKELKQTEKILGAIFEAAMLRDVPELNAVICKYQDDACRIRNRLSAMEPGIPDKDAKRPIMAVTYWFREKGKTREVIVTIFRTEEELGKDPLYTGRKFFEGLGIRGQCRGAVARRVEMWQRKDPVPGEMMLEEFIRLRQERGKEKTE